MDACSEIRIFFRIRWRFSCGLHRKDAVPSLGLFEELFVSAELLWWGGSFAGAVWGKSRLYFYCYLPSLCRGLRTENTDGHRGRRCPSFEERFRQQNNDCAESLQTGLRDERIAKPACFFPIRQEQSRGVGEA